MLAVIGFGCNCMAACPEGDLDGNCTVDFEDLRLFASSWLDDDIVPANLNKTGLVDISDFAILGDNWGEYGYKLVINELMAVNAGTIEDPDEAEAYPDWFEIYNYGSVPIDVGGMFVTDKLSTPMLWQIPSNAPDQTTILPGEFKLFWADEDTDQGPLHVNFKLSAGGEAVGLFDSSGKQIDAVSFDSLGEDDSWGRYPNGGSLWQLFDTGTATPGSSNGGESADRGILIHEIMYHPGHDEAAFEPEPIELEYIEIVNASTSAVLLDGWRLVDGVSFAMPSGAVLDAGEYLVIAANPQAFAVHYPQVTNIVGGWTGKLSNSGEQITLVNAIGTVIDTVRYCDEGDWGQRVLGPLDHNHRGWLWSNAHDGDGKSLELVNLQMANEYGQNWKASLAEQGTPGRPNSAAAVTAAPIILDVSHNPVVPSSTQSVTVAARILDQAKTGVTVLLRWRLDESVYVKSQYPVYEQDSYTEIPMLDDGLHGDGQAGDGVYGAVVPAQPDHTIIEFFLEAADGSANTRTWPAPCQVDGQMQQVANLLYQVDDSFASDAAWQADKQPTYYIIMTEAERQRLETIGSDNNERYSDAQMNAAFISVDGIDTRIRYGVGVRNRGEGTRRIPPNNYHVNFRRDHLWKEVSAININSKYTYLQLMGSVLFQKAGLVAADATAVQVRINGENLALTDTIPSRMYGTYVHLEAVDGDFADNHFPDDGEGNIYKASISPQVADLTYRGTNPADYVARGYTKGTNESENNWSDLFELTNVLQNEPDETYLQRLPQVVNTEQWIRWYAAEVLMGNNETNLSTGYGDDYRMYCGINDPRFVLVTHDNDTILGLGDNPASPTASIWQMVAPHTNVTMTVIKRFLQHPEYVGKYYAELKRLTETVFAPANMNPLLDQMLGDFVPASQIVKMKQFVVNRNASVLSQIPQTFTAVTSLSKVNGFYQTTASTVSVNGTANAIETRAVRVNGLPAVWAPVTGTWSCADVPLKPGINRVIIQTFDHSEGLGTELFRSFVDIWYNDGNQSTLSGTLATNIVLDAASGPWQITGDVIVPAGMTLTIEPGTTLFFDSGTGITVNGQLQALGSEFARIRMTRVPGGSRWDGIKFSNTLSDNRLGYVDMEYGDSQGESVSIQSSRALLDNMTWVSTGGTTQILDMSHPSALITHCIFPSVGGIETVHGTDLVGQEYLIFADNTFGSTSGYNDIVDFTGGQRPGPIIQFYNNTFLGGGDDGPDLDSTDAHVEGNLFTNFHQTTPDQDSPSYAVATGDRSQVCIVRNIFVNNDHAILHKEDVYSWTQNNTIVNCAIAAVSFGEPFRSTPRDPGKGTYLDSNIFWNNAAIFEHYFDNPVGYGPTGSVGTYRNLLPKQWHAFEQQNIDADPMLKDPLADWTLLPGSVAIGSGSNGQNMGAGVPAGASVWGQPEAITHRTDADLTVSGPGITHYKYRLVDNGVPGAWSDEIVLPINADDFPADPNAVYGRIHLDGLQQGHTYHVDVIGKNSAGLWQGQRFRDTDFFAPGNCDGNSSAEWTVDTSSSHLMIHEVLANNLSGAHEGTYPDMIELYYEGPVPLNLGGYRLTDDMDLPARFVFPDNTLMNPGDYRIVYADTAATSGIHTGFALDADGDKLYLLDSAGTVMDSVTFGTQLPDLSIGRMGDAKQWTLTEPTPGAENKAAARGDFRTLKINEWLADGEISFIEEWLEIYNPSPWPVDMGGLYVTDDPVADPNKCQLPPLSFIGGLGYAKLTAGGKDVTFSLNADGEMLALYDASLNPIDNVIYGPQTTDISMGRWPDGASTLAFFDIPTPGAANPKGPAIIETTLPILAENAAKRVWIPSAEVDSAWKGGSPFDDSAWTHGVAVAGKAGGVGYERNPGDSVNFTDLISYDVSAMRGTTGSCYIRIPFTLTDQHRASLTSLTLHVRSDDAFVAYINGAKAAQSSRVPTSPAWNSYATGSVSSDSAARQWVDFVITDEAVLNTLQAGQNMLAIHALDVVNSSDFLMSCMLDVTIELTGVDDIVAEAILSEDAAKRVFIPAAEVDSAWQGGTEFDDTTWTHGVIVAGKAGGVGYENNPGDSVNFTDLISYDVSTVQGSCYIRVV